MKIINPSVTLLHATHEPERTIERCGRACYQSGHKVTPCPECHGDDTPRRCPVCRGTGTSIASALRFVKMIIDNGHESVLEHAYAGFSIVTDRGVTHEQVRHRLTAISQESTRFCNYEAERFGRSISVIEPPWVGTEDDLVRASILWEASVSRVEADYFALIEEAHQPPQLARSVLQNCLKSEICVSANFREWRLILRQRTSPKAHPQMRQIAELIRQELLRLSPVCFEDIPREE